MSEQDKETDRYFLAVYGTLKENFPNYFYYLSPKKPIFRGIVSLPYQMYSTGDFPILYPSENLHPILIEVFEVSEQDLQKIDLLEGAPYLFSRTKVFIKELGAEVIIYSVQDREPSGYIIEEGIFRMKSKNEESENKFFIK